MSKSQVLEDHLGVMMFAMNKELFIQLAEIDEAQYTRLHDYYTGKRSRRPMGQKKLLALRSRFLDKLDAYEEARNIRPIV